MFTVREWCGVVLCDCLLLFGSVNIWKEGPRIYAFAFVVVKIMGIESTMVVKFIRSYLHTRFGCKVWEVLRYKE